MYIYRHENIQIHTCIKYINTNTNLTFFLTSLNIETAVLSRLDCSTSSPPNNLLAKSSNIKCLLLLFSSKLTSFLTDRGDGTRSAEPSWSPFPGLTCRLFDQFVTSTSVALPRPIVVPFTDQSSASPLTELLGTALGVELRVMFRMRNPEPRFGDEILDVPSSVRVLLACSVP